MSGNTLGTLFCVTSFGESHGPAIGCVVDGCPPGLELAEADIQPELDRRKPGTSRHVTQRRESDTVEILSGVFQGRTTGTPIGLLIRNEDPRSKDYSKIAETFRPGHADYTYWQKYGIRDYRGGGRQSARETAVRVAAAGRRGGEEQPGPGAAWEAAPPVVPAAGSKAERRPVVPDVYRMYSGASASNGSASQTGFSPSNQSFQSISLGAASGMPGVSRRTTTTVSTLLQLATA